VDREAVRVFAGRPWWRVEAAKRRYWAEEFARTGAAGALRAAEALRLHMRATRPEWPAEDDRREDLAHHRELKRRLDRASRALGGR
jgi:hypothetical protein